MRNISQKLLAQNHLESVFFNLIDTSLNKIKEIHRNLKYTFWNR